MRSLGCGAVYRAIWKTDQRVAGAAGNGEPAAGAAAAFGGFGRIGLRTLGGGPAGFSSANTGLGSMMVGAGGGETAGVPGTRAGNVTGWHLGGAKEAAKAATGGRPHTEAGAY